VSRKGRCANTHDLTPKVDRGPARVELTPIPPERPRGVCERCWKIDFWRHLGHQQPVDLRTRLIFIDSVVCYGRRLVVCQLAACLHHGAARYRDDENKCQAPRFRLLDSADVGGKVARSAAAKRTGESLLELGQRRHDVDQWAHSPADDGATSQGFLELLGRAVELGHIDVGTS